jgi:predicted GNAT family acetyltransferase
MEVLHKEEGTEGIFYMEKAGETVAEMTYIRKDEGRIYIDHTEVDDSLQGTGAAGQLLETAVAYAREHALKIVPLCPYVKHQFEKHPEKYEDVNAV